MRKSLCFYIMVILPALILGANQPLQQKTIQRSNDEIAAAWFKVPWTHGGYYWHNSITHEDCDHL